MEAYLKQALAASTREEYCGPMRPMKDVTFKQAGNSKKKMRVM